MNDSTQFRSPAQGVVELPSPLRFVACAVALCLTFPLASMLLADETVRTGAELAAAVREGAEGTTIEMAAGTFELEAPLEPKTGMTLKGAGMDKTIITHVPGWKPSTQTLPDPEMTTKGLDTQAYLIRLKDKAPNITVSDLTLRGPQLHGAIFGWDNQRLHLHHLRIQDTLWAGVRTFLMKDANIHDCDFKTIVIRDNVIECQGLARPLLRCKESYSSAIENNTLANVSDTDRFENPKTRKPAGLEVPLKFECGVHGEFLVDGWQVRPAVKPKEER